MTDLLSIADTLEARAEAGDPLSTAEMRAIAAAIRPPGVALREFVEASRNIRGEVVRLHASQQDAAE